MRIILKTAEHVYFEEIRIIIRFGCRILGPHRTRRESQSNDRTRQEFPHYSLEFHICSLNN